MGQVVSQMTRRSGSHTDDVIIDCEQWKTKSGKTPVLEVTHIETESTDMGYFEGFDIPNFNRRVNQGELLPHTPFRTFSRLGSSTGEYDYVDKSNYRHKVTGNAPLFNSWLISESTVIDAANLSGAEKFVQESAAKIYSKGFDALTFIAELKDVKRQFANVAKLLRQMSALKNWRKLNSEYLGARYGWRPLIYEITGLNEAIKNLNEARTRYSERAGDSYSWTTTNVSTTSWWAMTIERTVTTKFTMKRRGSVTADIEVPAFQFNPLQTGWELIPFSFVIDWFVSIGTSLAALSFAARQKAYAASAGYRCEFDRTFTASVKSTNSNFKSGHGFDQEGRCQGALTIREPASIPYIPHLAVKLNGMKILDLLALSLQRLK